MTISRRTLLIAAAATGGAVALAGGHAARSCAASVAAATARITGKSRLAVTRFSSVEYAVAGTGAPLMMLHGTGGGFDQGLRFARGLIERGFQVIAPSRFGYLRSDCPADPSPLNQADALADLLDRLGVDRLAVAGGSAGALPAAYFALRHPDRCARLILLVPAMNLTGRDPVEFTWLQRQIVGRLLTSDFWFWAALQGAPEQLIGTLLATDPALLEKVPEAERARAHLILNELMPISRRARGIANDGRMAGAPTGIDLSGIEAPMLVISAEDDRFGTAGTARVIASRVPSARLKIFPSGGHIWLGHESEVASEIAGFASGA